MIDPVLLDLLPPLCRARGDRLYGPNQKHWVDLWKQDGTWLLGHRPEGAAKEWKNQVDKGLSAWAPSHWPRRLEPLVRQLLPGTAAVRIFRNADRARTFFDGVPGAVAWKPWDDQATHDDASLVWPVLPTGPGQAAVLAFTRSWTEPLPSHDVTSPAEAAGLVHAAAQVIRFTADPRAAVVRKAAGEAFDLHLGKFGLFRRQGIWFEVLVSPADYPSFFKAHLEGGFLLNPDHGAPGVIPDVLSQGEWKAWEKAVDAWKDGRG